MFNRIFPKEPLLQVKSRAVMLMLLTLVGFWSEARAESLQSCEASLTLRTPRLTLRPPEPAELNQIKDLFSKAGELADSHFSSDWASLDEMRQMVYRHARSWKGVKSGRRTFFVIVQENRLIGYLYLSRHGGKGDEFREIAGVIDPEYSSQGLAVEALSVVAETFSKKGYSPFLYLFPYHTSAIQKAEKAGFEIVDMDNDKLILLRPKP